MIGGRVPLARQEAGGFTFFAWRPLRLYLAAVQRRGLRSNEPAQILLCALIGGTVGALVEGMRSLVEVLHRLSFLLPPGTLLSAYMGTDRWRIMTVPAVGGLFLGLIALLWRRFRHAEIVDPIEANALYGGRMSLVDSVRLAICTMISNAAGASLGMEAGYSQFGAGLFSWVGKYFHLRREDQRVFVTAGAAAAIAAAFNAPLTGTFYGFELILGSYLPRALAPVTVASVCGTLMQQALGGANPLFSVSQIAPLNISSYLLFGVIGIFAAGVAILAMLGVTWCEKGMRRLPVPEWLRPAIGGLLLSGVAFYFPQVLGSGHGAIQYHFQNDWALLPLMALLGAKLVASAVSLGSGFRGGLFSSSLFLGCLFGASFGKVLVAIEPAMAPQYHAFLLVGMGAMAAAIVGAPFTMVFLVLEATGNFPVTAGVLVGVIISATIVRLTFGYSFATWRFHVRGLGIRGAHDVGWIADLTVGRLMRADAKVVRTTMSLSDLRQKFPIGSAKRVFAIDPAGSYSGYLDMANAHDPQIDEAVDSGVVADLVEQPELYLIPGENVRVALNRFEDTQTESLPVLAGHNDRRVIGYLTEAYALRRYAQELERRRSAELGEQDLFSLGRIPR